MLHFLALAPTALALERWPPRTNVASALTAAYWVSLAVLYFVVFQLADPRSGWVEWLRFAPPVLAVAIPFAALAKWLHDRRRR